MKINFIDIETVALPDVLLPKFDESEVAVGNLKDPEKIKAKIEQAKADWKADAALSPMTGSVAMIGIKSNGKSTIADAAGKEKLMLDSAVSFITSEICAGHIIAGFSIFSFDLPFIVRRLWAHGVTTPQGWREGRYWSRSFMDLREEWLLGERAPAKGTSSLGAIARFLGLPEKLGDGADFAGMTQEQRVEYLNRDLDITEALYNRMFQP